MADPRYEIDWSADLTPALARFQAARNASKQNARADEYLKLQKNAQLESAIRHSAEEERQNIRDDHQRALETWNAMPTLQRAAMKSVGMANTNPYGVKFDETHDLPANVEGPEMSPDAEAARFAPKPAPAPEFHPVPQPPTGSLLAGEEGPELDPAAEAARHTLEGPQMAPSGYAGGGINAFGDEERQRAANNLDVVGAGLHGELPPSPTRPEPDMAGGTPDVAPAPEHPMIAAARNASGFEAPGPEGKRRLFGTYQGSRFEVPEQSDHTPFGPDYDSIYQGLLEAGEDPHKAMQYVAQQYKAAQSEKARDSRLADTLGFRGKNREDQQDFQRGENEKYRSEGLTFDQRMQMIREGNKGKIAAAGAEKPSAADASEAGAMKTFITDLKDYRDRVAQAGPEVKATRNVGEIARLANSPNPVDQALAVEQIGKIAHGGNTVTKATQDLIYHHMGGAFERGEAALKQYTDHGRMAPAQIQMLKDTAAALAHHHEENKATIKEGAEIQFGPNSSYGSPYIQPFVRQHLDALYKEMGVAGDAQTTAANPTTEGSIRLGRRRGAKTGTPGGAHVDPMRAKAQRALDDPHAPPEAKEAARKILGL